MIDPDFKYDFLWPELREELMKNPELKAEYDQLHAEKNDFIIVDAKEENA